MSKFTKGPWGYSNSECGWINIFNTKQLEGQFDKNGKQVLVVGKEIASVDFEIDEAEENLANARLIAKAPEMYAIIEDCYNSRYEGDKLVCILEHFWRQIKREVTNAD